VIIHVTIGYFVTTFFGLVKYLNSSSNCLNFLIFGSSWCSSSPPPPAYACAAFSAAAWALSCASSACLRSSAILLFAASTPSGSSAPSSRESLSSYLMAALLWYYMCAPPLRPAGPLGAILLRATSPPLGGRTGTVSTSSGLGLKSVFWSKSSSSNGFAYFAEAKATSSDLSPGAARLSSPLSPS